MKQHVYPGQEPIAMGTTPDTSSCELGSSKRQNFDPVSLCERVGGDMELLRELIELFCEECPAMLSEIGSAVTEGNSGDLQRASHKMKGSVLQFSAADATVIAGTLEEMGETCSLAGAAQEYAKLRAEIASLMEGLKLMVSGDVCPVEVT